MRRMVKRIGLSMLALVLLIAAGLMLWEPMFAEQSAAVPFTPGDVRIARDAWGVPHIFGASDADTAYGIGYAHAEDDFSTLQDVLAMTRGRLGAISGADGAKVDFAAAWIDGRGATDRHYAALPADVRQVLTGYAAGLNLYAERHPEEVKLRHLFPVTPQDVAAGFAIRSPFFFGLDDVLGALIEDKPLPVEGGPPLPGTRSAEGPAPAPGARVAMGGAATPYFAHTLLGAGEGRNGSNGFAVAPRRTTDGATWLVSNSHQPWTGGVAWYELVVHSGQGWDFAGATFPGSPYPFLGHNRNLGWTNTVNRPDLIDVYRLTMDASGTRYRFDGAWRPLESRRIWLRVRYGPFVIPVPQTVERSIHGPVIRNSHGVFAVRYAGIGGIDMVTQYFRLQKAQNFEQWSAAMAGQGVPATNFIYADRTGRIGMFYNAMFPDRPDGYDWRHVVPGDTSADLWRATLPFSRVPRNLDPASGYVINANNTPYTAAGPGSELNPADFDPRMGIENDETNRSLRAIQLFEAAGPIDEARLKAIKFDTGYVHASYAAALMAQMAALDTRGDADLAAAQRLLGTWDWTLDGRGGADALALMVLRPADRIHYKRLPETPDARAILSEAAGHLQRWFGRIDPPMGTVLRLRHGTGANAVDLPMDGGNDTLRAATLWHDDPDGRLSVYHGDSFIMFVRWDRDGTVHSESIQPFGAATTRPQSPHYNDQAPLFVAHRFKPVLFDRAAFLATNPRFYRP